jgi:pterin-4a-carbinolamine dehydratase
MARLSDEEIEEGLSGLNKVTVTISTHSEGGLTANDFELARRIEALG